MEQQSPVDRAKARLIVHTAMPLNAESFPDRLIASFLTDQRDFYLRNHGDIPELGENHEIAIGGLVSAPGTIAISALKAEFSSRTITATLQCAGNRRGHLQRVAKTSGDPWNVGAIGNARWTGISLGDLLERLGVQAGSQYVSVTCADSVDVDGVIGPYGISIPLGKARDPDVLLAWSMNDEPLRPEHGAPIRLIVPGFAGVRSAKWLTRIDLTNEPSQAAIQAKDYKLFPGAVSKEDADWSQGLTIDAMPLNSAICIPVNGAKVPSGNVSVLGYAIASGRRIARVEVSVNGAAPWVEAELDRSNEARWSWTQWRAKVRLAAGIHRLTVRAIDESGQMQPERPSSVWNFAGYLSTAWHRIRVTAT